jgi:hypothetical protein
VILRDPIAIETGSTEMDETGSSDSSSTREYPAFTSGNAVISVAGVHGMRQTREHASEDHLIRCNAISSASTLFTASASLSPLGLHPSAHAFSDRMMPWDGTLGLSEEPATASSLELTGVAYDALEEASFQKALQDFLSNP